MKRKRLFLPGAALALLLALTPAIGRGPFHDLEASDIRSASVKLLHTATATNISSCLSVIFCIASSGFAFGVILF